MLHPKLNHMASVLNVEPNWTAVYHGIMCKILVSGRSKLEIDRDLVGLRLIPAAALELEGVRHFCKNTMLSGWHEKDTQAT
jgi:hypothetical protein